MKKKLKRSRLEELDERMQMLERRRVQAYNTGMSYEILRQLENMIEETRLDMYTESELQIHRRQEGQDPDDSFIV
jgi:putative IMPACT (imprinted ancient) family translation regulator